MIPDDSDAARNRALRLAAQRSHAWRTNDLLAVRALTAELEQAWDEYRRARAGATPPAHVAPADDYVLDRFLLDQCVEHDGHIALAELARALHDYTSDAEERDDLPSNRRLARQLRARGIEVVRRGGTVWILGLRLVEQDETTDISLPSSHS